MLRRVYVWILILLIHSAGGYTNHTSQAWVSNSCINPAEGPTYAWDGIVTTQVGLPGAWECLTDAQEGLPAAQKGLLLAKEGRSAT